MTCSDDPGGYPYDLGDHTCDVRTAAADAQVWFNRGLIWTYGFNHDEAVRCFERAVEADDGCAMAWWGIGYAAGPNYNQTWDQYDDAGRAKALGRAYDATVAAQARIAAAAPWEAALIEALAARYPQRDPTDLQTMERWHTAYAKAMGAVFDAHGDRLDVRALYVEALMNQTPWKMWDIATGTPAPAADTVACQAALEAALEGDGAAWRHPGILHLYVHLMEMSPTPEVALRAGDALRELVPDAGHLIHMPTHIDVQCGHYRDAVHWNQRATVADLKYYAREGAFNIYTGYRQHNYHFAMYGAMLQGQFAPAMAAVAGIRDTTPEPFLRIESPPIADFFEPYLAFEPHVLVRFGRWREAIALPEPEDPTLYCTHVAWVRYARGVAHAALGDVDAARAAEEAYAAARTAVPESRVLHNNKVHDLLAIGALMLDAEITYREGRHDAAFDLLRRAVAAEDGLHYDEPWGWMQPVRHALGALLFEQGHVAAAEAAFREDLGLGAPIPRCQVHPDNIWALRGLHDCLRARGAAQEAAFIGQRLTLARARADTAVGAACFCAQAAMNG